MIDSPVIPLRRRHLTPPVPASEDGIPSQRRQAGGTRREASERISLLADDAAITGWTLNLSRGGARLVLDLPVELGGEHVLVFGGGDEPRRRRPVRVVWVQDEPDGQIIGVQFLDVSGGSGAPPPS